MDVGTLGFNRDSQMRVVGVCFNPIVHERTRCESRQIEYLEWICVIEKNSIQLVEFFFLQTDFSLLFLCFIDHLFNK